MQSPGDSTVMDPGKDDASKETANFKKLSVSERYAESPGEPTRVRLPNFAGYSGQGSGSSRSTPEKSSLKGILKNRDMRSPVAPNALDYTGPSEGINVNENSEEHDDRFTIIVDSREMFARKVKAGLTKKRRVRSTSTESAPELTFYPKREHGEGSNDATQEVSEAHSKTSSVSELDEDT